MNKYTAIISFFLLVGIVIFAYILLPFHLSDAPTNQPTKLYFADNISIAHQELIRRFNEAYKEKIEVIPVNLPFTKFSTNERKELLARALRSKNDRVDVFAVDLIWVPRFAKWALPLDKYLSNEERSGIIQYSSKSCSYDDVLLASPLYIDIGLMYYRRDIIATLPDHEKIEKMLKESITWEDFIRLSERFKNWDGPFYIFPADNFEGLVCSFVETVIGQNQQLVVGDSIQINTPQARKGLNLLVDLVNKYHMTPPIVTKFDENQGYFYLIKHNGIFLRGWPGLRHQYQNILADTTKLNLLECAALPHFKGYPAVSVFGGWNLMISKSSKKKKEAIEFIKFVLRKENQEMMFEVGGYLPANVKVYQDTAFIRKYPELKYYRKLLERGIHRPYLEDYTKISDIVSYYIHLAIRQEVSVPEALQSASRMINSKKVLIK